MHRTQVKKQSVEDSSQGAWIDQPVATLRGCIHQRAVLTFEFRFEGVDAVIGLRSLTPADGENGSVMTRVV